MSSAPSPLDLASVQTDASEHADPRGRLRALIDANWTTQAIAASVRLGLPDLLMDMPKTADVLAAQASCHPPSMLRLLRALTSISILAEGENGRFGLTETGRLLGTDVPGSLAAWAELCGTTSWVAWSRLDECVRSGLSVRKQSGGAGGFDHLAKSDTAALLFNRAMVGLSRPIASSFAAEVDFADVGCVVDVGGGFGELITALLTANAELRGVLFDMGHAIDCAHESLAGAKVADRCELVAGDFFDRVPTGADVYLLKSVLHDWNDDQCTTILINCAKAMPVNATLMIVERLMPEHFLDSARDRGVARGDLNMLVAQEGRERTLAQYEILLRAAGLRLQNLKALSSGFDVLTAGHV